MLAQHAVLQNRYRIVRQLGRGGMGAVYQAIDDRLDRTVALKETLVETDELRQAFEREARLLANLRHPTLPKVLDHFSDGDGLFLVMEFIPGEDLGALLLNSRSGFPYQQVLLWADQLLDALQYLHSHHPPVIHRDIKPANLKLAEGHVILLDFGLAKGVAGQMSTMKSNRSILGYTPNYAPLEQAQGGGTDPRSDLYALGATLYHLATGIKPADSLARADAVVNGNPDPLKTARDLLPQIPMSFSSALTQAMALNRDRRPVSADEMFRELHNPSLPYSPSASANRETTTFPGDTAHFDAEVTKTSVQGTSSSPPAQPKQNRTPLVIPVPQIRDTRPVDRKRKLKPTWAVPLGLFLLLTLSAFFFMNWFRSTGKQSSPPIQPSPRANVNLTPGAGAAPSDTTDRQNTSPEARAALATLRQKKIPFTENSFVHAVQDGDVGTVELFLAAGMTPNIKGPGKATPLILAGFNGHHHISHLLLDKGADVNARDDSGLTSLMGAASRDHQETLSVLLAAGAEVDTADNNGETALLLAAKEGKRQIVRMLLNKGARVDLADKYGRTALTWAAINNHPETVQLLRIAGGA